MNKNYEGKILIFKRFTALSLTFLMVSATFAYEKSDFFVGIQGGGMGQEKTITNTQYNLSLTQQAIGGATTSGTVWAESTSVGGV